ncbi:MAG: hypothetical protein SFU20_14155 [Chitinophagaceae bacterium]|nr:hypothetical protein [Chitinophagaceae bacterium]
MTSALSNQFGLSIGFAAFLALLRVRSTESSFYPFYFFCWVGFIHELSDWLLLSVGYFTSWNDNVYALVTVVLVIWQFWEWGLWRERDWLYLVLLSVTGLFWLVETCIRLDGTAVNSWFCLFSSLGVVLMSIWWIGVVFYREDEYLYKNPVFLICFGFMVYYSVFILAESAWIPGMNDREDYRQMVYKVMAWVKLVTAMLFALSVRWVPLCKDHILKLCSGRH